MKVDEIIHAMKGYRALQANYVGPSLAINMLIHFNLQFAKRTDDVCDDALAAVKVRDAFQIWRMMRTEAGVCGDNVSLPYPVWTEKVVTFVFGYTFDANEAYRRVDFLSDIPRAVDRHRECVKILSDASNVPFHVQVIMSVLEMGASTERTIRSAANALMIRDSKRRKRGGSTSRNKKSEWP